MWHNISIQACLKTSHNLAQKLDDIKPKGEIAVQLKSKMP